MNPVLQHLLELGILHMIIRVVSTALVIVLLAYMIVSWIPQWREGKVGQFVADLASPIIGPLDRLIPPISLGGLRISIGFFVGWWAIIVVAALLSQAMPGGW
jgi:YggT family protein